MRDFTSAAMRQLADAEQARDEAEEHQRARTTRRRSCCVTAHDGTMSVAAAATRATIIASAVGWRRRSIAGGPGVAGGAGGANQGPIGQQANPLEGSQGSMGVAAASDSGALTRGQAMELKEADDEGKEPEEGLDATLSAAI